MDYLHTGAPQAIIHRDLKPGNVLMFSNNVLKIADFGLSKARANDESLRQMSSVGTFEYMAPEVIKVRAWRARAPQCAHRCRRVALGGLARAARGSQSEPYSEKCDVYSFGVMVWEMMTHQTPYQGIPSLSVAFGVGSGTLRLNIPARGCPPALQAVMRTCLSYDQTQRPSFHRITIQLDEGLTAMRQGDDGPGSGGASGGPGSDLGSDSSASSIASWSTDSHTSARDFFSVEARHSPNVTFATGSAAAIVPAVAAASAVAATSTSPRMRASHAQSPLALASSTLEDDLSSVSSLPSDSTLVDPHADDSVGTPQP